MDVDELDASEIVFFAAVALLAFINCLQQDGFFIGLICGAAGGFLAWGYYSIVRMLLETFMTEEKGRAVARKALEVLGLAIVMAVLLPKIVG